MSKDMSIKENLFLLSSFIWFLHWGSCIFSKLVDMVILDSVCQSVTYWFLNKYLPRKKINLEILHRGLKREKVCGYCDVSSKSYKPRNFLIELDTYMNKELYTKTLLHELVHLKQWVIGSLREKRGKMYYDKELVNNYEYLNQPHEIEAREEELILYDLYTNDKDSMTVSKAAHNSPNHIQFVVY